MKLKYCYILLLSLAFAAVSCTEYEPQLIKDSVTELTNDCIKRSLPVAPNLVGYDIEFAYAMAIPKNLGKLTSAQVVASIAGAEGTRLDPNSYYTNTSGQDVPVRVASDSETSGTTTKVSFQVDTCAATLRYYYVIPESARGKEVSFTFSVKASNGQTAEYKLGPYKISKQDIATNLPLTNDVCYLSFTNEGEAVHVYSKDDLAANSGLASSIDLMYTFSSKGDISYAFYTASSPAELLDGLSLPSGMNDTKMLKVYGLTDRQLADLKYTNFIDDLDFETLNMSAAINYVFGLKEQAGVWVETAGGKYRAFVYVNKAASGTMTVSVKRYKMK